MIYRNEKLREECVTYYAVMARTTLQRIMEMVVFSQRHPGLDHQQLSVGEAGPGSMSPTIARARHGVGLEAERKRKLIGSLWAVGEEAISWLSEKDSARHQADTKRSCRATGRPSTEIKLRECLAASVQSGFNVQHLQQRRRRSCLGRLVGTDS